MLRRIAAWWKSQRELDPNLKCGHCGKWSHDLGELEVVECFESAKGCGRFDGIDGFTTKCNNCHKKSKWTGTIIPGILLIGNGEDTKL